MSETKKRTPKTEVTLADIRARKVGRVASTRIQLNGGLASELEELRVEYEKARQDERGQTNADLSMPIRSQRLLRKLEQLVAESEESEQQFKFKALGRHDYEALVAKHPPRPEDHAEAASVAEQTGSRASKAEWNYETFPPALIAASSLEPTMTESEATDLWNDSDWNGAELVKLFQTALIVNSAPGDIPFGLRGIGVTPSTERKSSSASKPESLEADSSDE